MDLLYVLLPFLSLFLCLDPIESTPVMYSGTNTPAVTTAKRAIKVSIHFTPVNGERDGETIDGSGT